MTSRERRMVLVLGVCGVAFLAFAVYSLVLAPLKQATLDVARYEAEYNTKSEALAKAQRDLQRLPVYKKKSLPTNPDLVVREYQATLSKLLASSGITGATVTQKMDGGGDRSIPELAPKKPAYNRIGFDIRMQKVDLPTVAKFLEGYYKLNLMHQITSLDIKKSDKEGARKNDRSDLDVVLHTDAIMLDGGENRRTLEAVPPSFAAVAGSLGFQSVHGGTDDRRITPKNASIASLFAGIGPTSRDYSVMAARDPFHGSLPKPPAPPPPPPEKVEPPAKPKPDISPYIRLTGLTVGTTGIIQASLWDTMHNHTYEVTVKPNVTGSPEVKVEKFFLLEGKRKRLDKWTELVIAEDDSSTNRKFVVKGLLRDGLILGETTIEAMPEPRRGAKPSINTPLAAALGGFAAQQAWPTEKLYHWRVGQTLRSIGEMPTTSSKSVSATKTEPTAELAAN